jgi:hypothetical protein
VAAFGPFVPGIEQDDTILWGAVCRQHLA